MYESYLLQGRGLGADRVGWRRRQCFRGTV